MVAKKNKTEKNQNQIRTELAGLLKGSTLRAEAKKLGISIGFLHDVIKGRRDVPEKLANKLGYRLEIVRTVERKFYPV